MDSSILSRKYAALISPVTLAPAARVLLVVFWLLGTVGAVQAYDITGSKWLRAKTEYFVSMTGQSATQISWNMAFNQAIAEWNESTVFEFSVVNEYAAPCLDNGISSVDFVADFCGSEYGENVLAITVTRFEGQILGPPYIREADIVINSAEEFDIFDGPLFQPGRSVAGTDFRRVALHELGHVIGLGHEATNPAIMAPNISDLYQLQEDDIAGVTALHNGLAQCRVAELALGATTGALGPDDCTVQQLTAGGTDDSRLDLYRFDLQQGTRMMFDVEADNLDTVLIVATTDLEYLRNDLGERNSCDSSLEVSLEAGSYFLIVNTFDAVVNEDCGLEGNYRLQSSFTAFGRPALGSSTSLENSLTTATFTGGISADGGVTFANRFKPEDSLDISARIGIDPRHQGSPGFIVVAVLLEGQILMLNSRGQFVDVTAQPLPATPARSKTLEAVESISIATNLVPAALGIEEIEANIVVGYGLDSNPGDIFYHSNPINLIVSP